MPVGYDYGYSYDYSYDHGVCGGGGVAVSDVVVWLVEEKVW